MGDVVVSHGGYATEELFNNWIRYHSYDDWGIIRVDDSGIKFEGNKKILVISKDDIDEISMVHKKLGPQLVYILGVILVTYLVIFLSKSDFNFGYNLIFVPIIFTALITVGYYLSNWIKVVFNKDGYKMKLYFSVSWNVGLYPKWRMWTDGNLLSWQDNKRIYKILKKST